MARADVAARELLDKEGIVKPPWTRSGSPGNYSESS